MDGKVRTLIAKIKIGVFLAILLFFLLSIALLRKNTSGDVEVKTGLPISYTDRTAGEYWKERKNLLNKFSSSDVSEEEIRRMLYISAEVPGISRECIDALIIKANKFEKTILDVLTNGPANCMIAASLTASFANIDKGTKIIDKQLEYYFKDGVEWNSPEERIAGVFLNSLAIQAGNGNKEAMESISKYVKMAQTGKVLVKSTQYPMSNNSYSLDLLYRCMCYYPSQESREFIKQHGDPYQLISLMDAWENSGRKIGDYQEEVFFNGTQKNSYRTVKSKFNFLKSLGEALEPKPTHIE